MIHLIDHVTVLNKEREQGHISIVAVRINAHKIARSLLISKHFVMKQHVLFATIDVTLCQVASSISICVFNPGCQGHRKEGTQKTVMIFSFTDMFSQQVKTKLTQINCFSFQGNTYEAGTFHPHFYALTPTMAMVYGIKMSSLCFRVIIWHLKLNK